MKELMTVLFFLCLIKHHASKTLIGVDVLGFDSTHSSHLHWVNLNDSLTL